MSTSVRVLSLAVFSIGCAGEPEVLIEPADGSVVVSTWKSGLQNRLTRATVTAPDEVLVVCDGICRFQLASDVPRDVTVRLQYSSGRPFESIEGLELYGAKSHLLQESGHTRGFVAHLTGSEEPVKVLVVDYWRL